MFPAAPRIAQFRRGAALALVAVCFAFLSFAAASPAQAQGRLPVPNDDQQADELTGVYRCQGTNYEGTVTITRVGGTYHVRWRMPDQDHGGAAIRTGDILSCSFKSGRLTGVAVYQIGENQLTGRWAFYDTKGEVHTETLTYLRPLD
ncbi:MAG: hypothetical protein DWQ31_04875 [Planctomycetota bacterium]|nr:MAG: hypothetical protein DWQ31_04875 [Planctomycetota bacterium]REJ87870.1 MAG: hypothetical protein DWQ35_20760 [Planctomycetota bacterium]REK26447.1 MAG: hypothetical protein DWQ42_08970 [Planctomycetota bacterium]REK38716.1 MAG: hypothetical protein DWQ46_20005 [Planctomycetota bacterium]